MPTKPKLGRGEQLAILAGAKEEMRRDIDAEQVVEVVMDTPTAWTILGQLQLALRHPMNTGPSAERTRRLALEVQAKIAPSGARKALADLGWDPRYDEAQEALL